MSMIYAYQNSSANVARATIKADTSPKYTRRISRHADTNKLGTIAYLVVYGTLSLIDIIAVAQAFAALAKLMGV